MKGVAPITGNFEAPRRIPAALVVVGDLIRWSVEVVREGKPHHFYGYLTVEATGPCEGLSDGTLPEFPGHEPDEACVVLWCSGGDDHFHRGDLLPVRRQDQRSVYFLQSETGGPIKIGVAEHATARLAEIQRMSPVRLRLVGLIAFGGYVLERTLHAMFADARLHGEWFEPTPELLAFIAENASSSPDVERPNAADSAPSLPGSPKGVGDTRVTAGTAAHNLLDAAVPAVETAAGLSTPCRPTDGVSAWTPAPAPARCVRSGAGVTPP